MLTQQKHNIVSPKAKTKRQHDLVMQPNWTKNLQNHSVQTTVNNELVSDFVKKFPQTKNQSLRKLKKQLC